MIRRCRRRASVPQIDNLNPSVLGTAFGGAIARDRFVFTHPLRHHAIPVDVGVFREVGDHAIRAPLRELPVVCGASSRIGMTLDLEAAGLERRGTERRSEIIQRLLRLRSNFRRADGKFDRNRRHVRGGFALDPARCRVVEMGALARRLTHIADLDFRCQLLDQIRRADVPARSLLLVEQARLEVQPSSRRQRPEPTSR